MTLDDPERDAYHHLSAYTLTHGDPAFIHQHVVDAFAAQQADGRSKPIGVAFALAGLYLHVERRFTGRQVQLAHMKMARQGHTWPAFVLPAARGSMTALEVMRAPEGPARDAAIDAWCASVWNALGDHHQAITELLRQHGIV